MSDLGRYLGFWPLPRGRANRCIDAGDRARQAENWEQAAFHYRRAVTIQPRRRSIWIQLGHAEKEIGRSQAALEAYARAGMLPGGDGEAAFHHGLQAKAMGLYATAKGSFARAIHENPDHSDARGEWQVMLYHPLAASERDKADAAQLLRIEQARLAVETATDQTPLVFEVTDLLHHFRNARLPTGVQRVQIEVIRASIPLFPNLRICCFTGGERGWVLIPLAQFQTLCALALVRGDMFEPEWVRAAEMLAASIAQNAPVDFAPGDVLVNLGTSWVLPNYFLNIRHAKRLHGIHYVPFVHDLIPVVAPYYCLPDVVQDYLGWIGGVFDHADRFLTNSRSTSQDLRHVAGLLKKELGKGDISVIPLDAAMPIGGQAPLPVSDLGRWGISADYVLFVSSIEPRKNHRMAFRAWRRMIARDCDRTPDLVCVGNSGWLNDQIHAMLRNDPSLATKVRILSGVSDEELALLYRHCSFTIYPSHYEGWGMPVTEALCHGKVPIVTRCASLPEAGGDFAIYVQPDDDASLARLVSELIENPQRLAALERRIVRDFQPRSWSDLALKVGEACRFRAAVAQEWPYLHLDTLYRMGNNRAVRLVPGSQLGEMLRAGLGWMPLDEGQVCTASAGGTLAFRVVSNPSSVICHLRFAALGGEGISVRTAQHIHHSVATGWMSFKAPVIDGVINLRLSGDAALSHVLVSDTDLAQVVARVVTRPGSDYAFLRDIYPLIAGREVLPAELCEFLPSLEAGGLTRMNVVTTLNRWAGEAED